MTRYGLVALRRAATLVHAMPALRVRLRDGERTLLHVARPPGPAVCGGRVIGPCEFRAAVARALAQSEAGTRRGFMGMPSDADPAVDVGVRPSDTALPGGMYRIAVGDGHVHAFATVLTPKACRTVMADVVSLGTDAIHLHADAATAVTLVHTGGAAPVELHAAVLTEEILREVTGSTA